MPGMWDADSTQKKAIIKTDQYRIVYDHYRGRVPPIRPRNFRLIRNIFLVVAVLYAAMFGVAMTIRGSAPQSVAVLAAAIIGAITCPAALLFALMSHLMRNKT
jgi:hypothetical protein